MEFVIYVLCIAFAVLSFFITYLIVKERSARLYFIVPIYINIVIIVALYTKAISSFGLLGILGFTPLCIKIKKRRQMNDKNNKT